MALNKIHIYKNNMEVDFKHEEGSDLHYFLSKCVD